MKSGINQNKKNKKKILLIVLFLVFLGALTIYTLNGRHAPEIIAGDFLPDEKENQKIDKKKVAKEKVDASQFTLSIYPEAIFNEKTGEGFLHIRNESSNAYPINVKIKIDNTNEIIYETGAIYPGHEVKKVTLEKKLKAGKYSATAYVDIFNPKSKMKQGTTQAEMQITIKD
ncbi:hypothetical protein KAF80_25510 [Bacillus sp. WL1]|uniref:hypothetical protein n=1 Tax=Bacillus TaxID=1386 RepID=UPI001B3426A3|nr:MULTISPECIES: hypothetical protein [Bacillus]MBP3972314.1 hypothetical protein [Bacillus sp. WL1]MEC2744415.1 hypothetical protein [Bacillus cereus]MEC2758121.1 hypothetical protein [Bacillus cereus]MEC2830568.1 hypothetical protein [Bacillus cereus]